ncbi:MAG: cytochrome o ubiquinol oxidase subunit IV [Candidatus Saccharimonadales bacterium]
MKEKGVTISRYIAGFALSVILTILAAVLVLIHINNEHGIISHQILIPAIFALAVAQAIIQLVCFLQLGPGKEQSWRMGMFISTVGIILIVIAGSIWIMTHLNYNMMPSRVNQYLQDQGGGF